MVSGINLSMGPPPLQPQASSVARMLVCDDDARSYEHIVSTLESLGAYVDQASNTMAVASLTSQKPYDLILFSCTRMMRQCADQLVALRCVYKKQRWESRRW